MKKIVFLNPQLSPNTIHPMGQKFKKSKSYLTYLRLLGHIFLQKYKGYGWRVLAGHSTISFQKGKKISKKVDVDLHMIKKKYDRIKKKNPEHSFNKQQNIHCKELPKHFKLPSMNAYDMPEKIVVNS